MAQHSFAFQSMDSCGYSTADRRRCCTPTLVRQWLCTPERTAICDNMIHNLWPKTDLLHSPVSLLVSSEQAGCGCRACSQRLGFCNIVGHRKSGRQHHTLHSQTESASCPTSPNSTVMCWPLTQIGAQAASAADVP